MAGTAVLAAAGYVAIEDIRKGDYVCSWDEETGEKALKQVIETYVNETDELVHLYARGEQIDTTPGHPFYVDGKGWYPAESLRAGDILVTINGERVILELVQHEILESPVRVYNLEVQDYHTYFVGRLIVWVHNDCGEQGSYEIVFESGKNYVGKGSKTRMKVSMRYQRKIHNDKVVFSRWERASDRKKAFVDEYFKQAVRGVNNSNTYNKIWSPGRKYFMRSMGGR